MSLTNIISYDDPADFVEDVTKITIAADARLKLKIEAGDFIEDFADDTGFTYDNTKAEFVAGVLREKAPVVANELFAATIVNSLDADRFTGSGTGTVSGTVLRTLVSGDQYIDITDTTSGNHIEYPVANADFGETGTIRFKYVPDYNTAPAVNRYLFNLIGAAGANNITMFHQSTQNIQMRINNASGSLLSAKNYPSISLTQGQEYEFEINFDFTTGATRFFIDGVQQGTTLTSTFSRGAITNFQIGASTGSSEAYFRDVQVFDSVQHTANFAGETPRFLNLFAGSQVTLPEMMHTGLGTVTEFNTFTTVETGAPRYTIQVGRSGVYVYYNGIAWISSDGTYAQANDQTTFNANVSTLNIGGEIYGQFKIHLPDSNTQATVDTLTANVSGETTYPVDNPGIIPNTSFVSDGLISFVENSTVSGSDLVKYHIDISGVHMYWDGAAWSVSDGTYAQSNTAAEVNTNAASLDLGVGKDIKIHAYLHSDDGLTTPILTSVTTTYSFSAPAVAEPSECVVFGYVRTLLGDPHAMAIKLIITNEATFYYNNTTLILPNVQTISANSEGNVDISVIETNTPATVYKFQVQYIDFDGESQTVLLGNSEVPNQTTVNISSLTFT